MVELLLIDGKYTRKIELDAKALGKLKKFKTLAVYAAVQFSSGLQSILAQLKKECITVVSSKPARTKEQFQILGCDVYHENMHLQENVDAYLYIGDGRFHPLALVFQQRGQKFKEVFMYDPIANALAILTEKDIDAILKKEKASLKLFLMKRRIGVLLTTKPGQLQFKASLALLKKYPEKEFYFFLDNTLNSKNFENFPFIEVWVNTACPRIGLDDAVYMKQPLINLMDALEAEKKLSGV